MKKHIHYILWFLTPIVVWAQAADEPSVTTPSNFDSTEIVEIPDVPVEGASIDTEAPSIREVTESLPVDTEIVLEMPGQGTSRPGEASLSSEETISVDFPDEDVRTILRNVADLFELNLVIPDTLQGRTSIKLRNISWRQAFEVVLDPLGYTYVEDRNIIRIKSIEELTTEPVDTRVFVANYARAADLQGSIAPLVDVAAGGRIQVDVRSNALVITERPSRMNKIQEIIERLDRATDQVMIESKFIEVSRDNAEDIGVDWSFVTDDDSSFDPGFVDGLEFGGFGRPNGFENGLLAVFSDEDFAVTLNALQNQTDTELVSNPTVVVMNNQEAIFQVGEDYPLREFTVNLETGQLESGPVEYRFVGIELRVTPSVNATGMIALNVHPTVSARLEDEVVSGPNGLQDQIFRTREAQTQVTIKDGYTIALGGLTDKSVSKGTDKIPILGDVPYLGRLFKSTADTVSNSNLIIFLTARTLNPDGSTYRDIIDPRVLEAVGHTDSQAPGYQVPAGEMQMLRDAEATREALQKKMLNRRVEQRTQELIEDEKTWQEKMKLVD